MNNVSITGRLTASVKLQNSKQKGNDTVWTNFSLAVDRGYEDQVDFIQCTAWNKTAEIMATYLGKGSRIGVTGSLRQNVWEDENGKKHYETYVNVNSFDFLDSKRSEDEEEEEQPKSNKKYSRNRR